jgi:hypothetical protein
MTTPRILQSELKICHTTNHGHAPQDDLSKLALMCNQGMLAGSSSYPTLQGHILHKNHVQPVLTPNTTTTTDHSFQLQLITVAPFSLPVMRSAHVACLRTADPPGLLNKKSSLN